MALASEVISKVLYRLEEDTASPVFWSRAEILILLNEGYIEFVLMSGYLQSQSTYSMIGSKMQAPPDDCMGLIGVQWASKPIEKTTIEGFDESNRRWDYKNGYLSQWAPCGLDRWFCDATPQLAYDVQLITLDQPAALAEASTILLEDEYIEALEDYTFSCARFKEGGGEFRDAQPAYDDFTEKAGLREQKTFSEMMVMWGRDPNQDTGGGYSTLDRS